MNKCEVCLKPHDTRGAIVHDFYYKKICRGCYAELLHATKASSGQARYNRDRDVEDHEADIRQPYGGDGKPDAQFAKLYPEQARTMFGEEGMRAAERA